MNQIRIVKKYFSNQRQVLSRKIDLKKKVWQLSLTSKLSTYYFLLAVELFTYIDSDS
jgi:hypothetical protein